MEKKLLHASSRDVRNLRGDCGSVIRPCVRAISKQGLGDVFIDLNLAVDSQGRVTQSEVAATDLPQATAECVRSAIAALRLRAGRAARWRETIRP